MVTITLDAILKVGAGPVLPVGSVLEPDSYSFATVHLAAAGGADGADTFELKLLPADNDVVLLGIRARQDDGGPATVRVTPKNVEPGTEIEVRGALVVASRGVLAKLVAGGPRTLTLVNKAEVPVTVDVLAALDEPVLPPG